MKWLITVALTAAMLAVDMPAATARDGVLGRWTTPGVSAVVELAACADGQALCGTIRWLWEPLDARGQPRLDTENNDIRLRSRPLIGLAILSAMKPAPGGWAGHIYNPEDGQTCRATMRLDTADSLVIEGCVLIVCRKQVWRRASTLADVLR